MVYDYLQCVLFIYTCVHFLQVFTTGFSANNYYLKPIFTFSPPLRGKHVKITPVTFAIRPCLQVDLQQCDGK